MDSYFKEMDADSKGAISFRDMLTFLMSNVTIALAIEEYFAATPVKGTTVYLAQLSLIFFSNSDTVHLVHLDHILLSQYLTDNTVLFQCNQFMAAAVLSCYFIRFHFDARGWKEAARSHLASGRLCHELGCNPKKTLSTLMHLLKVL